MVGVIDGFRWCLLGGRQPLNPVGLGVSVTLTAVLLASAIGYFRKTERRFADII
jgi:lipopolysaccharide transport system permease protein